MFQFGIPLRLTLAWLVAVLGSPFDPHPFALVTFPQPFFDGWFIRVVDHARGLSVACIFGSFRPAHQRNYNNTWLALLYTGPGGTRMLTEQHFVDQKTVRITPRSRASGGTRSSFLWQSAMGSFDVDDDRAFLSFDFNALRVSMRLLQRVPWDADAPDTAGPEGWAGKVLPTPCHYYVHSLASVASYEVHPRNSSAITGMGYGHMETNYGHVFPSAWVWCQAISASREAQLVVTGGRFIAGPLVPEVFVLAYRAPGLHWDFRSTDLDKITRDFDASAGFLHIVAKRQTGARELYINVSASPESFSEALFFPTRAGFSDNPGSVESYSSTALIAAYVDGCLVDLRHIPMAALEFGGAFRHVAEDPASGSAGSFSGPSLVQV